MQRQPPKPKTGVPSVRKHILIQRALFFEEMVTQVECNRTQQGSKDEKAQQPVVTFFVGVS
ncbi:MAG TPA: hypothetical protein DCO70_05095 [Verrucomicrobiales bacterium]|nr:hypothetical protein [Verrucomicrobiales bacterium]